MVNENLRRDIKIIFRSEMQKALRREEEDFVKYFIRRYLAVHKKLL